MIAIVGAVVGERIREERRSREMRRRVGREYIDIVKELDWWRVESLHAMSL